MLINTFPGKSQVVNSITFSILIYICCGNVLAQLSPGDLSESHQEYEGLTNCTECHELGKGPSPEKCLNCHTALDAAIKSKTGYHYFIMGAEGETCISCHKDHAGMDFKLINWPEGYRNFNHSLSGLTLHGKHAETLCRECHNPANILSDVVRNATTTDITTTYLGLDKNCLGCHLDEHRTQLGTDCTKCHLDSGFKGAERFKHSEARFNLTGKHIDVKCSKCHKTIFDNVTSPKDTTYLNYRNISHGSCVNCHKDKHEGKHKDPCESCHTTKGWKKIIAENFDHSKTQFPLIGKHLSVKCETCHKSSSMLEKMKHEQCLDCHQDSHYGQFARRDDKGRCESCHDQRGFIPAHFTVADHSKSRFQLEGAHLAQPCVFCHKVDETLGDKPARRFIFENRECLACHNDNHSGQFRNSKPVKVCKDCHTIDMWKLPGFDHDKKTKFKLVGAHKKVKCEGCHKLLEAETSYLKYRTTETKCVDCHVDPARLPSLISEGI